MVISTRNVPGCKEGRHENITCDRVFPPALSGAPAQANDYSANSLAEVREALILGYSACGTGWNDIPPSRYARLLRNGRWLDHFGHFVMKATYPSDSAALDDATFYARYLFEEYRDGLALLASYFGADAPEGDHWTHLLIRICIVVDIAQRCPKLNS